MMIVGMGAIGRSNDLLVDTWRLAQAWKEALP